MLRSSVLQAAPAPAVEAAAVVDPLADLLAGLTSIDAALTDATAKLTVAEQAWLSASEADAIYAKLQGYASATGQTENLLKLSETTIQLIEALPYIGTFVKNARLGSIADAAETAAGQANAAAVRAASQWNAIKTKSNQVDSILSKSQQAAAQASTVVSALLATLTDLSGRYKDSAEEASGRFDGDGSAAGLLYDAAFTALETRYVGVAQPLVALEAEVSAVIAQVEATVATVEAAVADFSSSFASFEGALTSVQNALNKISGLENALNAFTAPLNGIFNFLENPPSITIWVPQPIPWEPNFPGYNKKIDLFPPIAREDITEVIDFISGISDFILGFLDPILDPIVDAMKPLLQPLLDLLSPVTDLVNPMTALEHAATALSAIVDDVLSPLHALDTEFAALDALASTVFAPEEMSQPLVEGETRETFFGDDADNFVIGAAKFAPAMTAVLGAGTDISGAVLAGGGGNDLLIGTDQVDLLIGDDGQDLLVGGAEDDVLIGGAENDMLFAGAGDDVVEGGTGDDIIFGGLGDDNIDGGTGNDFINAGSGANTVTGGLGDDTIVGTELGFAETFIFAAGDGIDLVQGFTLGIDTLQFVDTAVTSNFVYQGNSWVGYGVGDFVILVGVDQTLDLIA